MALSGATWQQLLNQIASDFSRSDLVSSPVPVSTDLAWIYATQAIQRFQSKVFIPGQSYNQWISTIPGGIQNLYALPVDFEDDMQILQTQYGRVLPLVKISEIEMNQKDVQTPPIIGQAQFYCIYGQAANLMSNITATWQANYNYQNAMNLIQGPVNSAQGGNLSILDSNGNIQTISSIQGTGISGPTAPVWKTALGAITVDQSSAGNGVNWTCTFLLANAGTNPVLRLWPWPDQAYALTAIYQNKIPVPAGNSTSNFWTTDAEQLIRSTAEGLLRKNVFHDDAWQMDFDTAREEFNWLSGRVRQTSGRGRARPVYL